MLTYKVSISNSSTDKDITLSDFFVKDDLTLLSGTCLADNNLSTNDEYWIESFYYPKKIKANVTSLLKVKRNGYILIPQELTVNTLYYNTTDSVNKQIFYVEFNGNIYYNDVSVNSKVVFDIDGNTAELIESSSTINAYDKIYVENNQVTVDGADYKLTINSDDNVTFYDSVGSKLEIPSDWVTSHITKNATEVYKIVVETPNSENIDINSISKFGYMPYIDYQGARKEFERLFDDDGNFIGYGVNINGENYPFTTDVDTTLSIGNPNAYNTNEAFGEAGLIINDCAYKVNYDPRETIDGDFLCIETAKSELPILLNDIITLKSIDSNSEIRINSYSGVSYVFVNGEKYNQIENLCDTVIINGTEYDLTYVGDASHPYVGMFATVTYEDNTIQTFKVEKVENNKVKKLCKVKYNDGNWEEAYTIAADTSKGSSKITVKVKANLYTVNNNNGFLIEGKKYPIQTISKYYADGSESDTYKAITVEIPTEYDFKVIDTIGSNKFICEADLDKQTIINDDLFTLTNDIYSQVIGSTSFVVQRNINYFGNKKYKVGKWINEILIANTSTSILTLSQAKNRIKIHKSTNNSTIPISLFKNVNNSLSKENLITDYYYYDNEESAINKIVDLEKDIYRPVYFQDNIATPIDNVVFNLHFRTRDLETWKIIQDQGTDTMGYNISANNLFSNWFVTDYYPYNQFFKNGSSVYNDSTFLTNIINQSDLLGFLYFTTNDVQKERNKLSGSFLRLTYYDSRDPKNQNMLGTSTVYFDCDRYFDILAQSHDGICYHKVQKSLCSNWIDTKDTEKFSVNNNQAPTVLTEPYYHYSKTIAQVSSMTFDDNYRLSSRIKIADRYTTDTSSEGFYPYILKAFADKSKKQRIYLKVEFFHAGVGIKVPFVLATDTNKNAISSWDMQKITDFQKGYAATEVYQRQYIPLDISYSMDSREFVYTIASDNNYLNAVKQDNKFVFNLFELKTQVE